MKTICFVVPSFPTVSETFVTNQLVQAKLYGYQVIILTKKQLSVSQSSQKELLEKHQLLESINVVDFKIPKQKIRRRFLAFVLILKHLKYWLRVNSKPIRERFSILPFQLEFYRQFKNVSVFHVQFAMAGVELAKMKAIGVLPGNLITTFHGYDAHFKGVDELAHLQQRYKVLLAESKYLTANTSYLTKKVEQLGAEASKIQTIPMGVDLKFFKPTQEKQILPNTKVNLLSVGRLVALKGFDYAIKSVKVLVDKGYDVQYTIVGLGAEKETLEQLIIDLKLTKQVFLLGAKHQNEIKQLLEKNEVFLMSSITDVTGRAEAQGVVTAEAQAMGLPIVAFKSGGVPYTVIDSKTGFLVLEKDTEAYAQAIIKIIDNPKLFKTMSKEARNFAMAHFSGEKLALDMMKLYE